jgi:hypothetical protein
MSRFGRELWLLAGILLLATVLRVAWPTLTEFKFSEARLAALALEVTREGHLPLVGVPSSAGFDHSPISVYLYVPAFLATTSPIPATIYGGLVGVAAVALCWWLSRRWSGGGLWAASVASVLFAVSPWAVAFSRKIWQVAFVPLLTLIFVGLAVSALIQRRSWNLAMALVAFALLVQIHPSAISLALALLLWLIVFRRNVRLAPLLVGIGLGLLTTVPFLVHQIESGWSALSALSQLPEAVLDFAAARLAWEAITGRSIHALAGDGYPLLKVVPQLSWIFNLIGWLAVVAVLALTRRTISYWRVSNEKHRITARIDLVLLTWLVIPVIFNLRHSLTLHLHFFALIIPAAYMVIGRSAQTVFEARPAEGPQQRNKRPHFDVLRLLAMVGLGLLALAQVAALVAMGRFVATHETPGGFDRPLAHYRSIVDEALTLAKEAQAAELLVVAEGDSVVVDETPAIFDVLLRGQIAYRFVRGQSAAVFPAHASVVLITPKAGEAADWYHPWPTEDLGNGYRLVTLDGSWPQSAFQPVLGPRTFQNGLEIQGYNWNNIESNAKSVTFWLLWQTLWQEGEDTHFFVRFLDSDKAQWGQRDAVGYPSALRRKGDRIVSSFDITKPEAEPSEPYWVRIGLYTYPEVIDLPVIDSAGNPITSTILLGPLGQHQ